MRLGCAILAVAMHAGIFFAWSPPPNEIALIQVQGESVEVALVAVTDSTPQQVAEEPTAPPPAVPEPPTEIPRPEPPPILPRAEPPPLQLPAETTPKPELPSTPSTPPVQQAELPPAQKEAVPEPSKEVAPLISKPKAIPTETKATTQSKKTEGALPKGTSAAASGDSSDSLLSKPLYVVRPQVNYPTESRAAGEQGLVLLRITVNAGGRPTAVKVAASSGFSRLDRAAVEGGWRCRVSNAFEGAQFDAPLRFSLQEK